MLSRFIPAFLVLLLYALPATAQDLPPSQQLPPRAATTAHVQSMALPVLDATPKFNAARATEKYLARVNGAARARSDAYFEGGYWLKLVDLIYGLAVAALLLWLPISTGIRDWAAAHTGRPMLQVAIYAAAYVVIVTVLEFPLSLYEDFFREHAYGLSNQSFGGWFGDFATATAVSLVACVIALPILYAAIRLARRAWWIWGAGLTVLFLIVVMAIYPVAIAPLFNHYTPLPPGPLKNDILSLARANGIPAGNVWVDDASRQTNEISANVSGFLGTTRITLNDNLLHRGTHDEILAVLGHEMGHYVMGHTTRLILLFGLVFAAGFAFVAWGFGFATGLFGDAWKVHEVADVAGLPLLAALAGIFLFLATPVTNTITRTTEQQADIFGLNAVRKPDAFATAILKLSTYRKLDPGKWEEIIFYDHPSGRTRIHTAMVWKKEHIADPDIRDTANIP